MNPILTIYALATFKYIPTTNKLLVDACKKQEHEQSCLIIDDALNKINRVEQICKNPKQHANPIAQLTENFIINQNIKNPDLYLMRLITRCNMIGDVEKWNANQYAEILQPFINKFSSVNDICKKCNKFPVVYNGDNLTKL
jgi:hypothetical protein